jgi:membrane-bound serine protease (ClpP class)
MTGSDSVLLSNIVYLVLVAGVWLIAMALVSPGTGFVEALAIAALAGAGWGMLSLPLDGWAVIGLMLGAVLFGVALWRRNEWLWLLLSAAVLSVASAFLFRTSDGGPAVNPALSVVVSLLTIGFFWLAIHKTLAAARVKPANDPTAVVGQQGEARTVLDPMGSVYAGGELWSARAEVRIPEGAAVRVRELDGLILIVDPIKKS